MVVNDKRFSTDKLECYFVIFFNRAHPIISEMKRKIAILHYNYKFLIWIENKLLSKQCFEWKMIDV